MNQLSNIQQTMSSREMAEMTGKQHAHVMQAIRKMELAWEKVNQSKFGLVEYTDAKGEKRPEYQLSKKECLYIATKFNDEARAILINRWEELENKPSSPQSDAVVLANAFQILNNMVEDQKRLIAQKDNALIQANEVITKAMPKVAYCEEVLQSKTNITINVIAQELGITAIKLNQLLKEKGIHYKQGGKWLLVSKFRNKGYTESYTHTYTKYNGEKGTDIQTRWTELGRAFIHSLFKN
ncbi:phage regulatory protein/antirepressor Ant [Sphingobacterium sp. ML3W]|uniref:Rha family transcriptional regulator n=1 Tax=Sphingobacterium sp. ML3W TaxID=1538644 RepID=UPI00249C1A09|nr:phage regulatory protein/antirepressor Ant [Sphingobacterium sp. ML3W]WFA79706.1 phage regulatory protein/antirepressor Ant [Sphingobacterium sp. ML3W]